MKILKQILTLLLALFPACTDDIKKTSGSWPVLNKKAEPIIFEGYPVTIEWYKTTDCATMVELQKEQLSVIIEVFADDAIRNFLFDDQLHIRKEYADLGNRCSELSPKELNAFIESVRSASARLDRKTCVENSRRQWEQWFATLAQSMKNLPFTYFSVVAKNSKGNILGLIAFYISPKLAKLFPKLDGYIEGDVVLDPIVIIPAARGIGLARPLVFSILRLVPETKRILLDTRMWNTNAIVVYKKLGFTEYKREGVDVKFIYEVKK